MAKKSAKAKVVEAHGPLTFIGPSRFACCAARISGSRACPGSRSAYATLSAILRG